MKTNPINGFSITEEEHQEEHQEELRKLTYITTIYFLIIFGSIISLFIAIWLDNPKPQGNSPYQTLQQDVTNMKRYDSAHPNAPLYTEEFYKKYPMIKK